MCFAYFLQATAASNSCRSRSNLVRSLVSHVMTHILALVAAASMYRTSCLTMQTLHPHAVAHILALAAAALVIVVMNIVMYCGNRSMNWLAVNIILCVIISVSSSCCDNHHCCDSDSLNSSHNLNVFMSLSTRVDTCFIFDVANIACSNHICNKTFPMREDNSPIR